MKKIINFIKNKKIYFINIFIIITIFLTSLAIMNVYPFGNFSFTNSDANLQYQPMLYNFIEKIKSGLLESYTFNNGFGAPTSFNYIYYLSSPFNILGIFFKSPEVTYFFPILIRIIIGAITSTFYIRKKTNNNFISTIGSIGYLFSGWFLTFFNFNIWLDIFIIFPLFQYSLENLINKEKCKLYILLIAFMLISNFYIAFMVCLYTLIFFIFHIITKKEKLNLKLRSFCLITLSTIIAILLCFGHLYIIYDSFTKSSIIKTTFTKESFISTKSFLASLFYGKTNYILSSNVETAPNLCTSMLFTISFLYYFINKNIKIKEKIKTFIITALFIFILFSPTADFIINACHIPIGFQYRYSFILSFWYIYILFKNYRTFDNKINKKIFFINFILLILSLIFYKLDILDNKTFYINLASILCYTIFFLFYNQKNKYYKYILLFLLIIESICAFSINLPQLKTEKINTNDFTLKKYREPTTSKTHLNQNLYNNSNNISIFSSMNYKLLLNNVYLWDIGSDSTNHAITYDTSTIFEMFFNIKTEKPYYLEKVFAVNKDFLNLKLESNKIIFNEMIEKATTYKNALEKIEYDHNSKKTTITIKENGYYRINPNTKCFIAIKHNNTIKRYGYKESFTAPETIYLEKGSIIIISDIKDKDREPILLYKENEEIIKKAYKKLSKNQINYTHYSDSHMEGTITVDKDQIIYTSIPYDKDWEILIDGNKVQKRKILNEFIGFECEEGEHTISLKYKTHYKIPILVSIITAICILIHEIIKKKKDTNN